MKTPDIILSGKDNGEGMVIHYRTARETDIFGLAIPTIYSGTDWDLGPTWCYLIFGGKTTLIDVGRFGNFGVFGNLLKSIGKGFSDIDRIIITHSHEDHDGNLAEILSTSQAELWAHSIYPHMISYYPHINDGAPHPELPGSCRLCYMPEKFYVMNCLPYHKQRSSLSVDFVIEDGQTLSGDALSFVFTPGHAADSICIILENEVIFTSDTLLPDITAHPSLARGFEANRRILPEGYRSENVVYGLMNYIKSLNKIAHLNSQPFQATFPAHRLFYYGRFNIIHSSADRAKEIIQFHIDRCRDILKIVSRKPLGIEDIALQHFSASLLKGSGKVMAQDEVKAHVEVMEECGDIRWVGEDRDLVQSTGSSKCLDVIGAYLG